MADLLYLFLFVPLKNTLEKNDLGDSATPDVCVQTRNALIRDANAFISKAQSKSRPPQHAVINVPALHPFSGPYFLSKASQRTHNNLSATGGGAGVKLTPGLVLGQNQTSCF